MRTLSDVLRRDNNNFDLIRLIAALTVMLGHCYRLQPAQRRWEPIIRLTYGESFGSFAVYTFFILSGVLVSASYDRQKSVAHFAALRLARIWPGLAACSFVVVFIICPFFSTLPPIEYLTHPSTRKWFFHAVALIDGKPLFLPGVFEYAPFKSIVNGPMWTLPLEIKCYIVVLITGMTGAIGSKRGTAAAVAVAFAAFLYMVKHPPNSIALQDISIQQLAYVLYPFPFFLLGMLLYAFRNHIPISGKLAVAFIVAHLLLLQWATHWSSAKPQFWGHFRHEPFLYIAFVYGLLWVASSVTLNKIRIKNDYSYGIYLYGFVVQQVVASLRPDLDNYVSLLISVPITVAIAAMSWHFVERPCLMSCRRRFAPPHIVTSGP